MSRNSSNGSPGLPKNGRRVHASWVPTKPKFDQRSTALAAVTLEELAALTSDLPALNDESARSIEPASHARHLVLLFVIAFVALAALVGMMLLHP